MTSVQKIQPDELIYYQNLLNDIKQCIQVVLAHWRFTTGYVHWQLQIDYRKILVVLSLSNTPNATGIFLPST